MKKLCCAALALFLLCAYCPAAPAEAAIMHIKKLQTPDSRVRLRETPGGEVIGQYYAGTEVSVLSFRANYKDRRYDEWASVRIGGRKGYMMNSFLAGGVRQVKQTRGHLLPLNGQTVSVENAYFQEIAALPEGDVDVLGTCPDDTVHIAFRTENGVRYGFVQAQEITRTGDKQKASVMVITTMEGLKVRKAPAPGGEEICLLYPGVEVYRIFDDSPADSEWTRVRAGQVTGFVYGRFLDFSLDRHPSFRARPVTLAVPQAGVTGSAREQVYQEDPLFLLGKSSARDGRFLCLGGGWDESGEHYETFTCYVRAEDLALEASGAVSAKGKLREDSPLYAPGGDGTMAPLTDGTGEKTVYPAGTSVWIAGGLDENLDPVGGLLPGYLTSDTAWVEVLLQAPGQYHKVPGWLPLTALSFDGGLILPDLSNNG